MSVMEKIGFIGIGSQGGPMAERIAAAGYPLTLWARRADALAPFLAKGAKGAAHIADLGAVCDHVGICVVDDAGVAAIVDDLLPAMKPGSRIVVHSTILPDHCVALAQRCAERGVGFIDAPVSGGGAGAAAGTLTVMCGGALALFDAAKPVFETFGGLIVHMGDVGAGQRAKIVNNALMAANMGLAHAAMDVGAALGLDGAALRDLVKASSGRSFGFEVYARLPTPQAFSHGAPLLMKDVNLLKATLPGNAGAEALSSAADPFLSAASGI
ncbi:NAD(P)-dependent oxidoreductase [Sphingobium sp. BYY-5]|uniref:NAD(P)-dependent oxidoreductase n=1 Tax=Sphingobium sp. BYY-5 TaxID=2926400 RepID=UPI001FA700CD|nr:NAD(P)-dependent oxidoreductase [Sphingobium sp. BYY-5]MCI4592336.1 NAD(P)-dependent oxidoreductase [Sphingobium sp. BYY-5]